MSAEHIREALNQAIDYLKQNPHEAQYTDSLATAVIEEGLTCRIIDPEGREIRSDMPASIGGGESAPSPGWLFRAATASCVATLVALRAAQTGISLSKTEIQVDSESNDYGILDLDDSTPAAPLNMRVHAKLRGQGTNKEDLHQLVAWAVEHCPVSDAVQRSVSLHTEVDIS